MATKSERYKPISSKKPLPFKPIDVKKTPINPVVTEWLKETGHKAMHKSTTHSSYALPPAANISNGGPRFVKRYDIASPTEYIQFENLLSTLLGLLGPSSELRQSPRIMLPEDYTCTETSFASVRQLAQSTLAEQLTTLGMQRKFSVNDAWMIFSDVVEAVRDLQAVGLAHLGVKPQNVVLCADQSYKLVDLIFNEYTIESIKLEEAKRKEQLAPLFPHMGGKTEHTVVVFNKTGNEYIHTRNVSKKEAQKASSVVSGQIGTYNLVLSNIL